MYHKYTGVLTSQKSSSVRRIHLQTCHEGSFAVTECVRRVNIMEAIEGVWRERGRWRVLSEVNTRAMSKGFASFILSKQPQYNSKIIAPLPSASIASLDLHLAALTLTATPFKWHGICFHLVGKGICEVEKCNKHFYMDAYNILRNTSLPVQWYSFDSYF